MGQKVKLDKTILLDFKLLSQINKDKPQLNIKLKCYGIQAKLGRQSGTFCLSLGQIRVYLFKQVPGFINC